MVQCLPCKLSYRMLLWLPLLRVLFLSSARSVPSLSDAEITHSLSQKKWMKIYKWILSSKCSSVSVLTFSLTFFLSVCSRILTLVLQGDQGEVDTLPLHEVSVHPSLHGSPVLKADDHVSVTDGGESMCYGDGGSTHASLTTATFRRVHCQHRPKYTRTRKDFRISDILEFSVWN